MGYGKDELSHHVQAVWLLPSEELEEEAAWLAAEKDSGPHCVLSHPALRLLWQRYLPGQDEASWEVFSNHFPIHINR